VPKLPIFGQSLSRYAVLVAPPWRQPPERIPIRYDPDEDRRLTIRLEDDLREALTAEARKQLRSLCAEIKLRLRQSLERQDEATA
jgi:hypothetical protein